MLRVARAANKEGWGEFATGLGLTISKRLVELMHGNIMVESALGEGSVFYFVVKLDIYPEEQKPVHSTPSASENLLPIRLLLVEDYVYNSMLARSYLKNTPCQIDEAENGKIGVEGKMAVRVKSDFKNFVPAFLDLDLA